MIYKHTVRGIVSGLLLAGVAFAADPEPKVETPEFVTKGIEELAAEMEAVIKNPKESTRRENADFFEKGKSVEPQVLIDLLEKRLHKDPRVDSYIKWQLLSLKEGQFDEALTKDVLKIYVKAPISEPMPGVGKEQQMAQALRGVKKEQVSELNMQWEERLSQHHKVFGPQLAYRDALYTRLTRDFTVVRAGFMDAEERAKRGYEIKDLTRQLMGDLRSVAALAKPAEINQMQKMAAYYAGKEGGKFYKGLKYDDKKKSASWDAPTVKFDKKAFEELATALGQMSKSGF